MLLLLTKADTTSDSRGRGDSLAFPCVSHVELPVPQHPRLGGLTFNPRYGGKAHHNGTCRTRARLISWGIQYDSFNELFPCGPHNYPWFPLKYTFLFISP